MNNSAYRFFRPTLAVVACYVLAMLGLQLFSQVQPVQDTPETLESGRKLTTIAQPTPELSVAEVVQVQLGGLANPDRSKGILQCYTFASADNKALTGPLSNFAKLVGAEIFRPLLSPDRVLIGTPTYEDGTARVLVTMVKRKRVKSFVWVLSKQTVEPVEGCWMTDGVFPIEGVRDQPGNEI